MVCGRDRTATRTSPSSLHGCTCSVSRPQAMVSFRVRAPMRRLFRLVSPRPRTDTNNAIFKCQDSGPSQGSRPWSAAATVRRHGRRRRAYMDVLAACRGHRPRPRSGLHTSNASPRSGLSFRTRGPIRITPFSDTQAMACRKDRGRGLGLRPYGDTDVAVERTWMYLQRVAATGHGRVQDYTPQRADHSGLQIANM